MPSFSPSVNKGWIKLLYRTCGTHGLVPKALEVQVTYDRTKDSLCWGGYGDVWKGEHHGRDVAVKVLRRYTKSVLQKIMKVGFRSHSISAHHSQQPLSVQRFFKEVMTWKLLQHPNIVPFVGVMISENRLEMVSEWMDNGHINDFVEAHPEVDRFKLVGPPF